MQFYFSEMGMVLYQYHLLGRRLEFCVLRCHLLFIISIHSTNSYQADCVSGISLGTVIQQDIKHADFSVLEEPYILTEETDPKLESNT